MAARSYWTIVYNPPSYFYSQEIHVFANLPPGGLPPNANFFSLSQNFSNIL
jgi:hypothetical protein